MYKYYLNTVFGFHACCKPIADKMISGLSEFEPSKNVYDWLGHGMYFWENSYHRAELFAKDRNIDNPAIVGAALHLGYCLDLTDSRSLEYLASSYAALKSTFERAGKPLPTNRQPAIKPATDDLLLRDLDCAVINFTHSQRKESKLKAFDSVRGVFWEGEDLYPGAGFKEKNHIQICIVNPNCIKGFFWPRKEISSFTSV